MKTILSILCLSITLASAEFIGGLGYISYSEDVDDLGDVNLGLIYASVGFDFSGRGSDWALIPEVRFGTGFDDDSVDNVPILGGVASDLIEDFDFSVDSYLSFLLNVRYSWRWGYLQANVNYTSIDAEGEANNISVESNDGAFGVGVAFGLGLTRSLDLQIHGESFADAFTAGAGFRYKF